MRLLSLATRLLILASAAAVAVNGADEELSISIAQRALQARVVTFLDHKHEKETSGTSTTTLTNAKNAKKPIILKSKNPTTHNQRRRRGLAQRSSRLEETASRLTAEASAGADTCDAAFMKCLGVLKCVDCFSELQADDIDWASVTKDTPCKDVVTFLTQHQHCTALTGDSSAVDTFCATFDVCVSWEDDPNSGADKNKVDPIDCRNLTECKWEGFHSNFIGNGVCNDGLDGCYNTEICGFDGGDCCEDTCTSSGKWVDCGHDGYACKDPKSKNCDPALSTACSPDNKKNETKPVPKCEADKTLYRVVMYDSFGDGWDDTKMTISLPGQASSPVYQGSLEKGSQGTDYVCLSKNPACYHINVKGGVWGNEVSWEVKPMTDGAPAIAGGGAPMECDFAVAGGTCDSSASACTGKPNIDPSNDPEYKELKDLFNCIEAKCVIQVGACQKDDVCKKCFNADSEDYCYGNDNFNAVVDCALCQCTANKDSAFCSQKKTPGAVVPPNPTPGQDTKKECSPAETLQGGSAVMAFGNCTNFDQVKMMVTEFDENNFGDLDKFESCSHAYAAKDQHGGHTALGCLQILVNAMNGATANESNPSLPVDAIKALSGLLYNDAENFCDCAKNASDSCPLCASFLHFKTLLYESLDACHALDEIDCDAWNEFYRPCQSNLQTMYGNIDFSRQEQCDFVHGNCGGAGPFPSFRHLDCEKEIPKEAWDFYDQFAKGCVKGYQPTPAPPKPEPTTPQPAPAPTGKPPSAAPKPYVPPEERPTKPYVPPPEKKGKKSSPYTPPEERKKKKFGWFWTLLLLGLIGGGAYYYFKRRSDGFSFIRYRRMRNNFSSDDNDMYSGLALESSTSFEPPSLPPTPAALGGSQA